MVYSEQLGEVLGGPLADKPVAPLELAARLGEVAALAEQAAPGPAAPGQPARDEPEVAMSEGPVAAGGTTGAATGEAGEPQPATAASSLERHWQAFADQAGSLQPVGDFPWRSCFRRAAASHDVPESLLLAIASGESNFDPAARSHKDTVGLMQIRWPDTSRDLGIRREADLYDPCTNVDGGARYLAQLIERYDDELHLAVAAYNYGPGRIAPGRVPEGARWYSHYIYQHLQQVLGVDHVPSGALLRPGTDSTGGHLVLMRFNRPQRARDFVHFLQGQVPGLDVQQQSEVLGQQEVVLLYRDQRERERALASLAAAGLDSLVAGAYRPTPL